MYKSYFIVINKFIKEKHLNKLLRLTNINISFKKEIIRFNCNKKRAFYTHFKFRNYMILNFNLKAPFSFFNDDIVFYIRN